MPGDDTYFIESRRRGPPGNTDLFFACLISRFLQCARAPAPEATAAWMRGSQRHAILRPGQMGGHVFRRFHQNGTLAAQTAGFQQFLRVGAVLSADNHHHVRLAGELFRLLLALAGRRANGNALSQVGHAPPEHLQNRVKSIAPNRRLRDDERFFRQFRLFGGLRVGQNRKPFRAAQPAMPITSG